MEKKKLQEQIIGSLKENYRKKKKKKRKPDVHNAFLSRYRDITSWFLSQ